jgi:hypothetical protein
MVAGRAASVRAEPAAPRIGASFEPAAIHRNQNRPIVSANAFDLVTAVTWNETRRGPGVVSVEAAVDELCRIAVVSDLAAWILTAWLQLCRTRRPRRRL